MASPRTPITPAMRPTLRRDKRSEVVSRSNDATHTTSATPTAPANETPVVRDRAAVTPGRRNFQDRGGDAQLTL